MADEDARQQQSADFRSTLDQPFTIGQNTDGSFNIFSLAEFAEWAVKNKQEQAALDYATAQSEMGFPDLQKKGDGGPEDKHDLSDLDDYDFLLEGNTGE